MNFIKAVLFAASFITVCFLLLAAMFAFGSWIASITPAWMGPTYVTLCVFALFVSIVSDEMKRGGK